MTWLLMTNKILKSSIRLITKITEVEQHIGLMVENMTQIRSRIYTLEAKTRPKKKAQVGSR